MHARSLQGLDFLTLLSRADAYLQLVRMTISERYIF